MNITESVQHLSAKFGDLLAEPVEFRGETTLVVLDGARIAEVCQCCKADLGFDLLLDITSIDNHGEDPRFTVVYELASLAERHHLRLKTHVSEEAAELPTATGVWRTADWHEREIYDMMGIRFAGHPDLRRILMWEGYPYHPLRKDFPLAGKPTDLPEVAFSNPAPLEGGPFVTKPGQTDAGTREPRVRNPEGET